jgi:hypothetical protein
MLMHEDIDLMAANERDERGKNVLKRYDEAG